MVRKICPLVCLAVMLVSVSCGGTETGDSNSNSAGANRNAIASNSAQGSRFELAEPERYSIVFALRDTAEAAAPSSPDKIQSAATGNSSAASNSVSPVQGRSANAAARNFRGYVPNIENPTMVAIQEFAIEKLASDRRWSFRLAGLGSVVYLQKSGLKYLVLFDRKQYFEVAPSDLGFDPGRSLDPVFNARQTTANGSVEFTGTEQVASRLAYQYRVTLPPSRDQRLFSISLDQETRLPVRFQLSVESSGKPRVEHILEARELRLNPSQTLFDVPVGMTKIKTDQARAQIQLFVTGVAPYIDVMDPLRAEASELAREKVKSPDAMPTKPKQINANSSSRAANKSANRRGAILSR